MQEPKKQTALTVREGERLPVPVKPSYWDKSAGAYTLVSRALLIALPLTVLIFVTVFFRSFAPSSLLSFVKDMQSTSVFDGAERKSVYFAYEETAGPVLSFRGGLAVVNGDGAEIYASDGERLLEVSQDMLTPRAVASRKILLAYDFGTGRYLITNNYTRLHRETLDRSIYLADADDTGQYALLTSDGTGNTEVFLYNGKFERTHTVTPAGTAVGISLSKNGKYLATLSLKSDGAERKSVLELYRTDGRGSVFSLELEEELPLALSFTSDRYIAVLTDRALRVCNLDGAWRNEISIQGEPIAMDCTEQGCALALRIDALSAQNRVLVLDKKGNTLYNGTVTGDLTAVAMARENAFLLIGERVCCVLAERGECMERSCRTGAKGLVAVDGYRACVIYEGEAEYIYFND